MMGNFPCGAAEPVLWHNVDRPEIGRHPERFVKHAWEGCWAYRTPTHRRSALASLKRLLVDDLKLTPDYRPMTAYPFCDPAPDGFRYLRKVVETLGRNNADRIFMTDLKSERHHAETPDTILKRDGRTGTDKLRRHLSKCREYGLAGWWAWACQDTRKSSTGIRRMDGTRKEELAAAIRKVPSASSQRIGMSAPAAETKGDARRDGVS